MEWTNPCTTTWEVELSREIKIVEKKRAEGEESMKSLKKPWKLKVDTISRAFPLSTDKDYIAGS